MSGTGSEPWHRWCVNENQRLTFESHTHKARAPALPGKTWRLVGMRTGKVDDHRATFSENFLSKLLYRTMLAISRLSTRMLKLLVSRTTAIHHGPLQ
jgi:hypothetical protein